MIHLADLLAATGGRVHGPVFADTFADFCYDTRLLNPGELFLAVVTGSTRIARRTDPAGSSSPVSRQLATANAVLRGPGQNDP